MALLADQSADAQSNIVQGTGVSTLTFTMPANQAIKVESVVATVNNAAGAANVAELTIADVSGQVIATRKQDDAIPAGDSGSATFALSLNNAAGGIRFGKVNKGTWLDVGTTTTGPSGKGIFLDSSNGVEIDNAAGAFNIVDNGTGLALVAQNGSLTATSVPGNLILTANAGFIELAQSSGGDLTVTATAVTMSPQVVVVLGTGKVHEVEDHNGVAIFRVDENGDLHGKTGKTLTFDL